MASRTSSEASSSGDIELADLDDVAVTPNPKIGNGYKYPYEPYDQEDEDDGSRALLHHETEGPALRRRADTSPATWQQVKNIVIEAAPTLLFTAISLLFTGELLDQVSRWKAMTRVDELIMIIPVVLNLKGNLEMNLSARLGTAANVGDLDERKQRNHLILGNLSLLQVQATVVSFVAAFVAFVLSLLLPDNPPPVQPAPSNTTITSDDALFLLHRAIPNSRIPRPPRPINDGRPKSGLLEYTMVVSTAMSAACLSAILLGSFMCFLIVMCRRLGRDPDNIAPPIASCLGDLVTLTLIGLVSSLLINFVNTPIPLILAVLVVCSATACFVVTYRNRAVRDLLKQGWSPLFGAMIISSGTGIVLDMFVSRYDGFALLAVVISGLPGAVGSIFASRLSTALHSKSLENLPNTHHAIDRRSSEPSARLVMVTLLLITLPVELIFLAMLRGLGWLQLPILFVISAVIFFCCAVAVSLFLAQGLTNFLWSKDLDPDMYALPIHSALMDLVGQLLLVICFEIVSLLGVPLIGKATH
ncbi:solute carrier family 41 member 1 [Heliocybe sulcata]|uniref:Solute carrier family 41 member 1 n=1 Tax=Heliocybe sulcata TaxID=5364 RepID=A0A5C3MNB7_9AGAM|nr:solute carrier family 41 member 1 [Heliocybe sulcata]